MRTDHSIYFFIRLLVLSGIYINLIIDHDQEPMHVGLYLPSSILHRSMDGATLIVFAYPCSPVPTA